jgi:molecular chaperone DnaK/molecular chaperone HscA
MFTTFIDGQTNVKIHVLQGERELVKDCRSLAEFDLKDIPGMTAGMARIEVKFLIDADGILNVSAQEQRTGKYQSIEVKPTYGLTDEQVEQMILESFEYAESDIEARLVIEARNEAETVLNATAKGLADEQYPALSDEEKVEITAATKNLREKMRGDNHQGTREAIERLSNATMHLAELIMNSAISKALKDKRVREIENG